MEHIIPGLLEELNIPSETTLPENILTPAMLNSVAFTQTKPKGYHFAEVEEFVEAVKTTVKSFADIIHQRDKDIYKLALEADRLKVENYNITTDKNKLEIKTGIQADEEVALLAEENKKLKAKIAEMENQPSQSPAFALSDLPETEELQKQIIELNNQISQLKQKEQINDAWAKEAEAYVEKIETELEAYKKAYAEITPNINPEPSPNINPEPSPNINSLPPSPNTPPQINPEMFPKIRPEDL